MTGGTIWEACVVDVRSQDRNEEGILPELVLWVYVALEHS